MFESAQVGTHYTTEPNWQEASGWNGESRETAVVEKSVVGPANLPTYTLIDPPSRGWLCLLDHHSQSPTDFIVTFSPVPVSTGAAPPTGEYSTY